MNIIEQTALLYGWIGLAVIYFVIIIFIIFTTIKLYFESDDTPVDRAIDIGLYKRKIKRLTKSYKSGEISQKELYDRLVNLNEEAKQ